KVDGELVVGYRHQPVSRAVDDGDRTAPVALTRHEPVAQLVVDGGPAAALGLEPGHDLGERLAVTQSVEATTARHRPVLGAWELAAVDHPPDGQVEPPGELEVALIVPGHGHDRPGPVLEQHVVGD